MHSDVLISSLCVSPPCQVSFCNDQLPIANQAKANQSGFRLYGWLGSISCSILTGTERGFRFIFSERGRPALPTPLLEKKKFTVYLHLFLFLKKVLRETCQRLESPCLELLHCLHSLLPAC